MSPSEVKVPSPPELSRYSRQMLFPEIGEAGQRKLMESHVLLVGCGALGSVLADTFVRAGVGRLDICDRDFIEPNNLQRQVLFDENDITDGLPKAEAAARKLRHINSDASVQPIVADINSTNIERYAEGVHLLMDGTDNFETRFLMNDLAVKTETPWVYGAVIGTTGLCMTVLPRDTPCLRCVFNEPPPPEMNPTCDTAGVLAPTVHIVASLQALEAIKILTGRKDTINRHLTSIDAWNARLTNLNVQKSFDNGHCPCCKQGKYDYLEGRASMTGTTLCGRNAVQISPPAGRSVKFEAMVEKLQAVSEGGIKVNPFMVRCTVGDHELTLFADGRAIIKGTDDIEIARSVYARFIGA